MEELLVHAGNSRERLRTIVYNPAVISGAVWIPEPCGPGALSNQSGAQNVTRFFGEGVALELYRDCLATSWLWTGQCLCCGEEKWAVEVGGSGDEIALSLNAPDEASEGARREFIRPLLMS